MSKQIDALKLALEALEVATTPLAKDRQEVLRAITAIKEALREHAMYEVQRLGQEIQPEPPQRTWVGLTDEERREIGKPYFSSVNTSDVAYARAIEAKLKEKNT